MCGSIISSDGDETTGAFQCWWLVVVCCCATWMDSPGLTCECHHSTCIYHSTAISQTAGSLLFLGGGDD